MLFRSIEDIRIARGGYDLIVKVAWPWDWSEFDEDEGPSDDLEFRLRFVDCVSVILDIAEPAEADLASGGLSASLMLGWHHLMFGYGKVTDVDVKYTAVSETFKDFLLELLPGRTLRVLCRRCIMVPTSWRIYEEWRAHPDLGPRLPDEIVVASHIVRESIRRGVAIESELRIPRGGRYKVQRDAFCSRHCFEEFAEGWEFSPGQDDSGEMDFGEMDQYHVRWTTLPDMDNGRVCSECEGRDREEPVGGAGAAESEGRP